MGITAQRLRVLAEGARACEEQWDAAREARDRALLEADDAGWKIRQIARETGMSPSHVQRIIADQTALRQAEATG